MKKILVLFFVLFLSSCSGGNELSITTTEDSSVIFEPENNTIDVLLRKLNTPISKDDFRRYFITTNNLLIFGFDFYTFPQQEKEFIENFKVYFNKRHIIEKLKTSKDVLSSDISQSYKENARKYLFLNTKKDYLFNLEKFYEMNGVCLIVFGGIKDFLDIKGELVKPDKPVNLNSKDFLSSSIDFYVNELNGNLLGKDDLKKYLNSTDEYLYDEVEEILYALVYFYDKEKNIYYKNKFYEIFNNNLSIKYSYEVFTLYFKLQAQDGKNIKFCDKFNQEYFLGE